MNENVPDARTRNEENLKQKKAKADPLDGFHSLDSRLAIDRTKVEMLENRIQTTRQRLVDDIQGYKAKENVAKETEDDKQKKYSKALADKEFKARNSYLTELFKVNHMRAIYNVFIVMLIVLLTNTAVHDYLETGTIHLGLRTIKKGFGNVNDIIRIWTIMTATTFFTYLGFLLWSTEHVSLNPKSNAMKVLDYSFLFVFIAHQIVFIAIPAKLTIDKKLPAAAGFVVLTEQVRMLMKTHAFVRSNVPRVLSYKLKHKDDQAIYCPEFSKFLYFLFAPTLIYRDEYPRTKSIRWKVVIWNLLEVVMIIFYAAFVFERIIIPPFLEHGPRIFEPKFVIINVFNMMLPGTVMWMFGFYSILHATQNAMAELLRFADRLFYKDWWNATSFGEYFRIWNILVHDWLRLYIYKEIYLMGYNKTYATIATFVLSAIVHEYILTVAFRFFYPVLFFSFAVFSLFFVYFMKSYPKLNRNIYVWLALITGQGVQYTLYPMEFYARANCPPYSEQLFDMLLPRSWICHTVINGTMNAS